MTTQCCATDNTPGSDTSLVVGSEGTTLYVLVLVVLRVSFICFTNTDNKDTTKLGFQGPRLSLNVHIPSAREICYYLSYKELFWWYYTATLHVATCSSPIHVFSSYCIACSKGGFSRLSIVESKRPFAVSGLMTCISSGHLQCM